MNTRTNTSKTEVVAIRNETISNVAGKKDIKQLIIKTIIQYFLSLISAAYILENTLCVFLFVLGKYIH